MYWWFPRRDGLLLLPISAMPRSLSPRLAIRKSRWTACRRARLLLLTSCCLASSEGRHRRPRRANRFRKLLTTGHWGVPLVSEPTLVDVRIVQVFVPELSGLILLLRSSLGAVYNHASLRVEEEWVMAEFTAVIVTIPTGDVMHRARHGAPLRGWAASV